MLKMRALTDPQQNQAMNTEDNTSQHFGIRVSIPDDDPFANLVGDDWKKLHWFATAAERDTTLQDMQREHEYSRRGDKPTLVFERIDRGTGD